MGEDDRDRAIASFGTDDFSLRAITFFLGASSVSVSVVYLLGFWGSFHLNVLEFMGIGDVLSHAMFPLFLIVIVSLLMAGYWQIPQLLSSRGISALDEFLKSRISVVTNLILTLLVVLLVSEPDRWILVAAPISLLGLSLAKLDYTSRLIPHPRIRSFALVSTLMLATLAFGFGREDGYAIQHGRAALLVDVGASGLVLPSDEQRPVGYVGHIGDSYILYESVGSRLVILKADRIASLVLIDNPARNHPNLSEAMAGLRAHIGRARSYFLDHRR
jgi:hypothetical protein